MFNRFILNPIFAISISVLVALGPAAVNLRTAGNFAILAQSSVSTVPPSAVVGAVGLSPAASTFLTGWSLTPSPLGTFSISTQCVGSLYAANYASPTPAKLITAVSDMKTAALDAAGRTGPNFLNLGAGNISGLTLAPGLYKWTSALIIPTNVVISGSAIDTWIFQVAGTLTMSNSKRIMLAGGALAHNIVWVVSGAVTVGTSSHFEGILLGSTGITFQTGSSINGRLLAQTAVSLQKTAVVSP
ncbi:hypothetical protein M413DRAFT_434757 [Hebeloma cylindrosporum]|uniref:Antifreeze protein n=1 Tax=Hebeloma cylindrosporum TaxID=76867 RepID=A0A0C3C4J9_HEBCY|nr:hypothetical protein M413DRAFT_434757 [Hebeloma cylindrosporum h7]